MKKICLVAIMAVMAFAAKAQLYVGGEIGVWRADGGDNNTARTTAAIMPEIGYNLNEKFAVGTTIGWEHSHVTGKSYNMFGFNPYARYTFFKSGIVSIFCDGAVGFGAGKTSYKDDNNKDSKTAVTWEIGLKPGVAFKCSDRFSVVAHLGMLGYQGANNAAKDGGAVDQWGLMFSGNNISLGFYYNF